MQAEAYDAATKAVMDMREEKYFKVADDLQYYPELPTSGPKRVSVLSFATTSNTDQGDPGGAPMTYCGRGIRNLEMLRPFTAGDGSVVAPYKVEGKHVYPTFNSVSWSINRIYTRLGLASNSTATINNPPLTNDANLVQNLPIRCRIVHVTPKLAPGITTAIAPSDDLFISQFGLPYSPKSSDFTYSDIEYAQVNRRKYSVISDQKFTLVQPFCAQLAVDTGNSGGDAGGRRQWRQMLTNGDGSHTRKLVTKHQLAQKKGGAVYYETPDTDVVPTTGHRREYVFMHFWYDCADGGGDTPPLGGQGIAPDDETVKIHWRIESRFKEA
tara:strand:- start:66 stop:1043 length:978 start_codon:yes stop_codon:yes gene_type:complete